MADETQLMPAYEYLHRLVREFPRLKPLVELLGEPLADNFAHLKDVENWINFSLRFLKRSPAIHIPDSLKNP